MKERFLLLEEIFYSMDYFLGLCLIALLGAIVYLLKEGKLDFLIEMLLKAEDSGLELLKLPEKTEFDENDVSGVELIQFKGKEGLELLVPPWLKEVRNEGKNLKIQPHATLLTGKNLTGYFLLLTKMLFLLESMPVFLIVKERDIDRFKRHSNILISIFKQKSGFFDELKMIKYQFHKGLLSEEDFKKKLLSLKMREAKSTIDKPMEDGCKYFSNPSEILRDVRDFIKKTHGKGLIVATMLDEMMEKKPKKAQVFLDDLAQLCSASSTKLILTSEQGVFAEKVNNVMKSYCDVVMETRLDKGNRFVRVYSFEKVFPEKRVSETLKDYKKFLKKVGFVKEK